MSAPAFVDIDWRGRAVTIEYQWVGTADSDAPLVVFLHEGLGSRSMWKDFPEQFCARLSCRGLVYSRPGYGASTPRAPDDHWAPDFMHHQAEEVLPALFAALGIMGKPWLLGHSDGGSIALLYAGAHPDAVAGVVAMAPHFFVEDKAVTSIRAAREAYLKTDLRQRLSRYHADPDSAFWGWNDIWLDPEFLSWNIAAELAKIPCPVLAMQGEDDEYGTLEQVWGIRKILPATEVVVLPQCGHSPHRDQAEAVMSHAAAFIAAHPDGAVWPATDFVLK